MKIDEMGNIFAIYPGTDPTLPPIGMGSHLDTQPAGKFPSISGLTTYSRWSIRWYSWGNRRLGSSSNASCRGLQTSRTISGNRLDERRGCSIP